MDRPASKAFCLLVMQSTDRNEVGEVERGSALLDRQDVMDFKPAGATSGVGLDASSVACTCGGPGALPQCGVAGADCTSGA